jgi:hypothetical protein
MNMTKNPDALRSGKRLETLLAARGEVAVVL